MAPSIWQTLTTVLRKEATDNLRDRRSVFNALLGVLINPLLFIFLFGFLNSAFSEQATQTLELPVVGAENAPNLVDFLDQQNVEVQAAPEDPEAALLEGDVSVVLVIPDEFPEQFEAGTPATVEVMRDESNQGADIFVERTERLLQQYGQRTASLRLLVRGLSPSMVQPLVVSDVDVSPQDRGATGTVLNLLPVIMFTAAFMGGFYMVVDMTAGEKERESLEPLLINPAPRWAIVMGKYLMGLIFTILATALATGVFLVLLQIPMVQEFTAIRVSITAADIFTAVLVVSPVVFMAVALQTLIASWADNVKEAQTYTQILSLAGFMPALFLSILPIRDQFWMYLVPTIGQLYLVERVMRGEALPPLELALATGITLVIAIAALLLSIRLYEREQIVV
jgi:sodium transport system permease protein